MRFCLFLVGMGWLCLCPSSRAQEPTKKPEAKSIEVPYRLTIPKHILIRAKINGKGPFNFILDTGAPALFVSTKVCEKLGIAPDKKGWGTFDRFEIEGGVVLLKAAGRIENPFQLEGMNGLGLAGAELHGIIGYNILAQYRMEIDVSRDKMTWTKLDWTPKPPEGLGGAGGQGGMEVFGDLMKFLGKMLGKKATPDVVTRGFVGVEVAEEGGDVVVKSVLAKSPGDEGGLKEGDRISKFDGRSVYGLDGLDGFSRKLASGKTIKVLVLRGKDKEKVELTIKTGEGL